MATRQNNLNYNSSIYDNFPFQKWNFHLYSCCRSWADTISDNRGISATVTMQYPLSVLITANQTGMSINSFICQMFYGVEQGYGPFITINSVKSFNYIGYMRALPKDIAMPFYTWNREAINGKEIFSEGFISDTLNIAFNKYLEAIGHKKL
jgi:hypothetical protein